MWTENIVSLFDHCCLGYKRQGCRRNIVFVVLLTAYLPLLPHGCFHKFEEKLFLSLMGHKIWPKNCQAVQRLLDGGWSFKVFIHFKVSGQPLLKMELINLLWPLYCGQGSQNVTSMTSTIFHKKVPSKFCPKRPLRKNRRIANIKIA